MLRHALERPGHTVLEARDEPEAIRILHDNQPAIVLSDLRLPQGDGFGVLRARNLTIEAVGAQLNAGSRSNMHD